MRIAIGVLRARGVSRHHQSMAPDDFTVRAEARLALDPHTAFETFLDELALHLGRLGLEFTPGPQGRVAEGDVIVGRVTMWEPGAAVRLEWRPASWQPEAATTELELRFEPVAGGTRITVEHRDLGALLGDANECAGWFAGQVASLMIAAAPRAFGDWVTDRRARRPSGAQARSMYRDPIYHRPNFRAIFQVLALEPDDYLVEVGCGGGAFLEEALLSGCRAAAIDHSVDMVCLARDVNREAIAAGRLTIEQATAERLPFSDGLFTCAVMTGVFGFLDDPVAALREMHRVLAPGGRMVVIGSDPAWRGTPAAPEPMASRLHFYEDAAFEALAHQAGFADAHVTRIPLDVFAREAGVPEEHLPLFAGPGAPFLIARKR